MLLIVGLTPLISHHYLVLDLDLVFSNALGKQHSYLGHNSMNSHLRPSNEKHKGLL